MAELDLLLLCGRDLPEMATTMSCRFQNSVHILDGAGSRHSLIPARWTAASHATNGSTKIASAALAEPGSEGAAAGCAQCRGNGGSGRSRGPYSAGSLIWMASRSSERASGALTRAKADSASANTLPAVTGSR